MSFDNDAVRIAILGASKSGKSEFIIQMSNSDSGICNSSLYFCKKLNRPFYIEWLEIPELKSENTLKLLLNTCHGVVVIIEACDMNHYTVSQYTSLIQSTYKISNSVKSYSESERDVIKDLPVLICSTKMDIYEKSKNNLSKYALIHNIEEVALNLLDSENVKSNIPTIEIFLEKVIEQSRDFTAVSELDKIQSNLRKSISNHRLEIRSSMGSIRSIPDVE